MRAGGQTDGRRRRESGALIIHIERERLTLCYIEPQLVWIAFRSITYTNNRDRYIIHINKYLIASPDKMLMNGKAEKNGKTLAAAAAVCYLVFFSLSLLTLLRNE